jgi:hypothetical protein
LPSRHAIYGGLSFSTPGRLRRSMVQNLACLAGGCQRARVCLFARRAWLRIGRSRPILARFSRSGGVMDSGRIGRRDAAWRGQNHERVGDSLVGATPTIAPVSAAVRGVGSSVGPGQMGRRLSFLNPRAVSSGRFARLPARSLAPQNRRAAPEAAAEK